MQYSTLAIVAHHPCPAEPGDSSFLVTGSLEDWQKTMRRIHSLTDFLIKMVIQRCESSRSTSYELEPSQVRMAVLVARQIFSSGFHMADTTRLGSLDDTDALTSAGPSAAKKKRLMSGFSELIEKLKQLREDSKSIPWLQITTLFVSTFPTFPEHYEMKELLNYVIDVTHDCRQYDMMSHCFRLFRVVCIAYSTKQSTSLDIVQPDGAAKLWESAWKCLIADQCHTESFLLMATLLNYRLVPVSSGLQLIQLLARPGGNSVRCYSSSILSLASFIQQYPLQERRSSGWIGDPIGDRSVRSVLSEWLLDCSDDCTDLRFRLFYALAMKQRPSLGQMDLTPLLTQIRSPTSFDTRCANLELLFRYVELRSDYEELKIESSSPATLNCSGPISPTFIEEQQNLLIDRCLSKAIEVKNYTHMNKDVFFEVQNNIRLLQLVRYFVSQQGFESTYQLREVSIQLLTAILNLVYKEESGYSRPCIRILTSLFEDDNFQRAESEDYLRMAAWRPSFRKVERLVSAGNDILYFDQVRRCSTEDEPEEYNSKTTSIFDRSVLETGAEQSQVDLFRLVGVLSCPSSWVRIYKVLKKKLNSNFSNFFLNRKMIRRNIYQ